MNNSNAKKRKGEPQREVEEAGSSTVTNGAVTSVIFDLESVECPVCFEPLAPPTFQCDLSHLICSSCCEKLPPPKRCHHCSRVSIFNRCYGVEKIVGSIQIPCSYSKYGCTVKTSYYQKEDHERKCVHAPCFCPETGCSFRWIDWNVAKPFHNQAPLALHQINFTTFRKNSYHTQSSEFPVPSTDLSDGIPRNYFLCVVPKSYLDKDTKILLTVKKKTVINEKRRSTYVS